MEPIRVPRPSPAAFHKNRRISDLLLSQITHFQHVAKKRALKIDPEVARDVHTEGGAARYIATVTRALRKDAAPMPAKLVPAAPRRRTRPGKTEEIPATGMVPRIAATAQESKAGRSKERRAKKQTHRATKGKSKAVSKVRAKAKPGKRKKS